MSKTSRIDQLIINKPFEEPSSYWSYDRTYRLFERKDGRRPAGYLAATPGSKSFDDPGQFHELPLVNRIRPRIKAWREGGDGRAPYEGTTGITKRLLEHWADTEAREGRRFFFCQVEAMETLIWLTEASPAERQGIEIPGDGGPFRRVCSKMATGSGKTIVMAMVIAWHVLNKATYPNDPRFAKNVLVVAPGLTVKNRLQVLVPGNPGGDYYDEFSIVPPGLLEKLRQGKVRVRNWHALNWEADEKIAKKKGVDKRGAKSDEAYVQEVLGDMANAKNLLVINDEAHHAWRVQADKKPTGISKADVDAATKWVGGLDRIHRSRKILGCYDFSATPFVSSGKKSTEESLFTWIVSDFGLNDAIESGLVKTPRVVVRDDGTLTRDLRSRFYHIYMDSDVHTDLNRKAEPHEPLPDLVTRAFYFLGLDWLEAKKKWAELGHTVPPVMISVGNRTETAARIKYAFDHGKILIDELKNADATLHIDSKVLEKAEAQQEPVAFVTDESDAEGEEGGEDEQDDGEDADGDGKPKRKLTKQQQAERLRQMVDTVGQIGRPGQHIQNVISVGMLSEGWDAKTVTHVMGLRAFSSQLLCEQVVGRGLRRTAYEINADGFLEAEYVNIFGVPFTFLPHEGGDGPPPPPPPPKTLVQVDPTKKAFEINWPNVLRIEHTYVPTLTLDLKKVPVLRLNAAEVPTVAELAPVVEGKPDVTKVTEIELRKLGERFRMQKIVFETARDVFEKMKPSWKGRPEHLLAQVIRLVERFITSDRLEVGPALFNRDDLRRRIVITLSMSRIVQHVFEALRFENTAGLEPIFDRERPVRSTGDMRDWYTSKPCHRTKRCHITQCAYDSMWEATEAFELERNTKFVAAWVKNDHRIGFEVFYVFDGVVHRYRPDFLIRLTNGVTLIFEVKGEETQKDRTKRAFLDEWVRAMNEHGGFGQWAADVSRHPGDVREILERHAV